MCVRAHAVCDAVCVCGMCSRAVCIYMRFARCPGMPKVLKGLYTARRGGIEDGEFIERACVDAE